MSGGIDWMSYKVAILVSGIARDKSNFNMKRLKTHFGNDLFCATWFGQQNQFSNQYPCKFYPEPEITYNSWTHDNCVCEHYKYHAYRKWFKEGKYPSGHKLEHASKQILGHAYQLQDLPEEYDMIVRARWDTFTSDRVDFTKYLEESFHKNIAIGFAIRGGRHSDVHSFNEYECVKVYEDTPQTYSRDWAWWLNDNLIIHPRKLFNCEKAFRLHNEKKLLPAEYGWYQMLSVDDNHKGVYGGAAIDRFVR